MTSSSARGRHHQFELHLGQQVHLIFHAAVDFLVALLAAVAADFGDGHAIDADFLERFFHVLDLVRLDDGFDLFHGRLLSSFYASKL